MRALVLLAALAPVLAFGRDEDSDELLAERFGSLRDPFEEVYGAPIEEADHEEIVGGTVASYDNPRFGSFEVVYVSKRVVVLSVTPPAGQGFEPDEMGRILADFLPDDGEVEDRRPVEQTPTSIVYEAHSEALGDEVSELVYRRVGAKGAEPGEFLVRFQDTNDVGIIDRITLMLGNRETYLGEGQADDDAPADAPGESRCLDVDPAMAEAIASGVEPGLTLRSVQAVRSEDFAEVYFIAADLEGPGLEGDDEVGVWASNSLEAGGGLILAVNEIAQEFSDWPDGDSTDAELSMGDDGAEEVRDCVADAL